MFQNFLNYIKENKDAFTVILSTFIGLIALATFIKALIEYSLQGRQKRAELYHKFDNVFDEENIKRIVELLETNYGDKNKEEIKNLPLIERYYFLGFYEQISLAVNSNLLRKEVAYYMFGKFAVVCWETEYFWDGIERESYDWLIFRNFIRDMQSVARNKGEKRKGLLSKRLMRSKFRF